MFPYPLGTLRDAPTLHAGAHPVVLVHGTASSPVRWAEMLNELQSDPLAEEHYEFWFFIYTTGNPILYSANRLRQSLRDTIAELDSQRSDPASREMVLIGHSQGGLLIKLQVIESGDRFWARISDWSFEDVAMKPETRGLLEAAVFVEPQPYVKRVIFISTPHRGSFLAGNWLGRIASSLFTAPQNLAGVGVDLARAGIDAVGAAVDTARAGVDVVRGDVDAQLRQEVGHIPSSVDNMNPDHHFIVTLSSIRVDEGVIAHSTIPVRGDPPPKVRTTGWSNTRAPPSRRR